MITIDYEKNLVLSNIKNRNPDFYNGNKDFYEYMINTRPQPEIDTSLKTPKYLYPEGMAYSYSHREYVAPIAKTPFYAPEGGVRRLRFNIHDDVYSFIDDLDGQARINIQIHGDYDGKKYLINHVTSGTEKWTPETYAQKLPELLGNDEIHHLHMMTCLSANGGGESYAAKVADITGLQTTGYRGLVATRDTSSVARAYGARSQFQDLSHQLTARPNLMPQKYQHYNPADHSWRPAALEKKFSPVFGSPGFDDMSSFLEGVFVL